ncbi:hypothetical protein E4U12_003679 [Claviceps purpurea]|nr:hypothetical protein E4U12_003679 [Claviceps purpurea]KAG6166189.1 hypothetical protein E4U51_003794 [Claviceps purpurea]
MDTTASSRTSSSHVLHTPIWVTIVRALQILISLVILGLAGRLMHDLYLDEFGLAVATSVLTWIIVFYFLLTEKISSWQKAYHVVAVLALEAFLVVLWLATFAAAAARRASFKVQASTSYCYDDGSYINSLTCFWKRALEKRAVLFKSGQDMFSAIAGLGALVWLLFIATFVYTLVMFLRGRKEGRFPMGSASASSGGHGSTYPMEPKTEQTAPVVMQQQQQQEQQQYQQPIQHHQTHQHQQPIQHQPIQHDQPHQHQPIQHKPVPNQSNQHQQHQPAQPQTDNYQSTLPSQQPPQNDFSPTQSPHQQYAASQPPQDHQAYHEQPPRQVHPESSIQHHAVQGSEPSGTSPSHQHHHQHSPSPPPTDPSPHTQDYHVQELGSTSHQL